MVSQRPFQLPGFEVGEVTKGQSDNSWRYTVIHGNGGCFCQTSVENIYIDVHTDTYVHVEVVPLRKYRV